MFSKSFAAIAVLAAALSNGVSAQFNPASTAFRNMSAVYWGQNAVYAVNKTTPLQYDLLTTCNNTNVDVVIVSFVTKMKGKAGYPTINLSDQCGTFFPYVENAKNSTDILNCPTVGAQITQCQKLGKKILLSIGGETFKDGWTSATAAGNDANTIWAMFGPASTPAYKYRPFGNAVFDGYDLDFESTNNKPYSVDFAKKLRAKCDLLKSKTYYLTAAPQCPSPDGILNDALVAVKFDAVFIQFYNNLCAVSSWAAGKAQTTNTTFNLGMWQTWATTKSYNKSIKLFVGALATNLSPVSSGYVAKATLQKVVADSMSTTKFPNFGGVSFWDSSCANLNAPMIPGIRDVLTGKVVIKRDVESASIAERDLKTPVGGASVLPADEFVEVKVPAEAVHKFRRRHSHHRRSF